MEMTNTENNVPVANKDSCKPTLPASLALSVQKETQVDVFKKPYPVAGSKRKYEILDEETYIEEIGRIIERDFFPGLEKLKAQTAYLEAVENNDVVKLREIYSKYSVARHQPPDAALSPATFETPVMRKIESSDKSPKKTEYADDRNDDQAKVGDLSKDKSLDAFLSCHTSEDNESFEELILETEERRRTKNPWLFKNETQLALPSSSESLSVQDKPTNVETWSYKNKNYIMYVPDGAELTMQEKLDMLKKKKEINHQATRFVERPYDQEQNKEHIQTLAHSQAKTMDGKIGIDGKELNAAATPNVNGYNFMKTPSPMPGVNESPLMTWGQIEGTPFRLDGSDTPLRPGTPGPKFRIAEPPVREKLAHRLAEKVNEKNRTQRQKAQEMARKHLALNSPNVTSNPFERFDCPSPGTPKLSNTYLKNRINTDQSLWANYSPRDAIESSKTSQMKSKSTPSKSVETPKRFITPSSTPSSSGANLTDNLLNLNVTKRPKSSDYFS